MTITKKPIKIVFQILHFDNISLNTALYKTSDVRVQKLQLFPEMSQRT